MSAVSAVPCDEAVWVTAAAVALFAVALTVALATARATVLVARLEACATTAADLANAALSISQLREGGSGESSSPTELALMRAATLTAVARGIDRATGAAIVAGMRALPGVRWQHAAEEFEHMLNVHGQREGGP